MRRTSVVLHLVGEILPPSNTSNFAPFHTFLLVSLLRNHCRAHFISTEDGFQFFVGICKFSIVDFHTTTCRHSAQIFLMKRFKVKRTRVSVCRRRSSQLILCRRMPCFPYFFRTVGRIFGHFFAYGVVP